MVLEVFQVAEPMASLSVILQLVSVIARSESMDSSVTSVKMATGILIAALVSDRSQSILFWPTSWSDFQVVNVATVT
jgi:hypothetical protein